MTSEKNLSRRGTLALFGGAAMLPLLPAQGLALSSGEASSMVQKVVGEIMAQVNSRKSEAAILAAFKKIFLRYADVPVIARAVLGNPWRSASKSQKSAFVAAFQDYLGNKYGRRFHSYKGSKVSVTGADDQGSKGVIVRSKVNAPGKSPFVVDWHLSDRSGSNKIINIYIEGVSMLSQERSEVRAMLQASRNNVDGLIAELRRRS